LNKIWPDFQLHKQADRWTNILEGTLHYPGQIKRKVKDGVVSGEKISCTGEAGVCSSTYYDFKIREPVFKLFDQSFSCIDLANAYGVKPDAFFFWIFAGNFAKTLSPAGPVAFVPDGPIYDHGAVGCRSQQVHKINYNPHWQSLQKIMA